MRLPRTSRRSFVKTVALGGTVAAAYVFGLSLPSAAGKQADPKPTAKPDPKPAAQPAASPVPVVANRFSRMFPDLPRYSVADAALLALAETMRDRAAGSPLGDNLFHDANGQVEHAIPAGLTYLGQFIDHDMTRDSTPLTAATPDVNSIPNGRTPALNLDSVYDGAPMVGPRFQVVVNQFGVTDVPRNAQGFAIIGDPRNDENLLLLPIHLGVMRFHNALLDKGLARTFDQARKLTRWHYQWCVVTEFLPAIIGQPLVDELISFKNGGGANQKITTKFVNVGTPPHLMPVEFAVACYRIHTLIRNNYNVRSGTRIGIFNTLPLNLLGFRPVPPELVMQTDLFFRMSTSPPFDGPGVQATPTSFNVSRRIDASISPQIYNLPAFTLPNAPEFNNLPVRNLKRGSMMGLAAGQDVARAMGITPLTNEQLNGNAANVAGGLHGLSDPAFQGKAPLWFYFNKEAELFSQGRRLGPVGGRIVGEVIMACIGNDPTSFVNKANNDPDLPSKGQFAPTPPIAPVAGAFTFGDFLRFAGAP